MKERIHLTNNNNNDDDDDDNTSSLLFIYSLFHSFLIIKKPVNERKYI